MAISRKAGAVLLGKAVTTEFANFHPSRTRNPLDLNRTPGGSSSGSAASVADFMAALSVGSRDQRLDRATRSVLRRVRISADVWRSALRRYQRIRRIARYAGIDRTHDR